MNRKFTTLFVILFSLFNLSHAQNLLNVKKSEYVDGVKERKVLYKKINAALEIYKKGEGYVNQVIPLLEDAYQLNKENAELNYNLGVCFLISGPRIEALKYLESARKINPDISEDIHFLIAMAHQYRNEFDKAIVQYKINIELIRQNNYKDKRELIALSEKRIAECKSGKKFINEKSSVEVELVDGVNSVYDEFNPMFDGDTFYFSSRRDDDKSSRSNEDQKFFEKIFGQDSNGNLSQILVNTPSKSNVALMAISNDEKLIYSGAEGNGDIFIAKASKNKLVKSKGLKLINENKSRESSVCFSKDGNELFFVSNRKGGFGDCDIYYCVKDENGKWSKPANLGGDINTEFDEGDVFVTKDGNKLYFSSRGHNTMGGYDIFKCERNESGQWERPKNLGFPINSTDNDITYFEDESGNFYFASERSEGVGGFDLYHHKEIVVKDEQPIVVAESSTIKAVPNAIENERMSAPEMAVPVLVPEIPFEEKPAVIEEVKMKQELVAEDFIYRVQIAACKKEMGPTDLFKRYKGGDVIEHLFVEGWHKYTIGGFATFDEAAKYRDSCGVEDAFVVLFKGGYRLGIAKKTGSIK